MSECKDKQTCSSGCSHCAVSERPPGADELVGWRLGLSAAGLFLFPMALATAGALIGKTALTQGIGCLGGLVVGAGITGIVSRILRRSRRGAV